MSPSRQDHMDTVKQAYGYAPNVGLCDVVVRNAIPTMRSID
jgi:hypothetical protein